MVIAMKTEGTNTDVTTESKKTRLVARVTLSTLELIKTAAELSGVSVSQFLTEAARAKAVATLSETQTFTLSLEGATIY